VKTPPSIALLMVQEVGSHGGGARLAQGHAGDVAGEDEAWHEEHGAAVVPCPVPEEGETEDGVDDRGRVPLCLPPSLPPSLPHYLPTHPRTAASGSTPWPCVLLPAPSSGAILSSAGNLSTD
jgi:hypothetical protein